MSLGDGYEKKEEVPSEVRISFEASEKVRLSSSSTIRNGLTLKSMKIKGFLSEGALDLVGWGQIDCRASVGQLVHCMDEVWYFLLHARYVKLVGRTVNLGSDVRMKQRKLGVQLVSVEVFLLHKAIQDDFELKIANYNKDGMVGLRRGVRLWLGRHSEGAQLRFRDDQVRADEPAAAVRVDGAAEGEEQFDKLEQAVQDVLQDDGPRAAGEVVGAAVPRHAAAGD